MIDGIPIVEYTPAALLGIGVIMLFLGWLVPRWYVRQLEARVEALEAANAELLNQNSEHLETTRLARSTWLALVQGANDG